MKRDKGGGTLMVWMHPPWISCIGYLFHLLFSFFLWQVYGQPSCIWHFFFWHVSIELPIIWNKNLELNKNGFDFEKYYCSDSIPVYLQLSCKFCLSYIWSSTCWHQGSKCTRLMFLPLQVVKFIDNIFYNGRFGMVILWILNAFHDWIEMRIQHSEVYSCWLDCHISRSIFLFWRQSLLFCFDWSWTRVWEEVSWW